MTVGVDGGGEASTEPTAEQPAPANASSVDRHAAFAAGPPKMPRKIIFWAALAVVVLGLGGTVADHFLSSVGGSTTAAATSTTTPATATTTPAVNPGGPLSSGAHQVQASLPAFMGLVSTKATPAPGFSLINGGNDDDVSLSGLRGHVVVLTFANADCADICPVLASELEKADAELGATPAPVTFVTVNTDPLKVAPDGLVSIFEQTALPSLSNWQFLTGTIAQLDPIWKAYGVSINADRATGVVTHNDVIYFLRPNGTLAWSATPFADETKAQVFSLPAAQIDRFASGIATYADKLAKQQ